MSSDTRYRAEQWFQKEVGRGTRVGMLCPPAIAPRLRLLGIVEDYRYGRPTRGDVLLREPRYPGYIVLSEKYFAVPELFDPVFLKRLLEGKEGYERVATFENLYLYPRRTIWAMSGWSLPKLAQVSPVIHVLRRRTGGSAADPR